MGQRTGKKLGRMIFSPPTLPKYKAVRCFPSTIRCWVSAAELQLLQLQFVMLENTGEKVHVAESYAQSGTNFSWGLGIFRKSHQCPEDWAVGHPDLKGRQRWIDQYMLNLAVLVIKTVTLFIDCIFISLFCHHGIQGGVFRLSKRSAS